MNAAQAAARAGVNASTVTRWIASGRLSASRLPNGTLEIPESALTAFLEDRTAPPSTSATAVALAVAEERIRGLESLVDQQREWLRLADDRLQAALLALPPARSARRWWEFWARP